MKVERVRKGWQFQLGNMIAPRTASNSEFKEFIKRSNWLLDDAFPRFPEGELPGVKDNTETRHTVEAVCETLVEAGYEVSMEGIRQWLDKVYPANIFDGSSGDPGAVMVVRLRNALNDKLKMVFEKQS